MSNQYPGQVSDHSQTLWEKVSAIWWRLTQKWLTFVDGTLIEEWVLAVAIFAQDVYISTSPVTCATLPAIVSL